MRNSAMYLLEFFNEETREENVTFDLQKVTAAISDVARQLDGLCAINLSNRFARYKKLVPELWENAILSFMISGSGWSYSFKPQSIRRLSAGCSGMLFDVRDNCLSFNNDEAREQSITEMLGKVTTTLDADDTISCGLKQYIMKLVHEVELATDLEKTGADFVLTQAIDRLMSSLNIVQAFSGRKDLWRELRDTAIIAFTTAFFSGAGQAALGAVTGQVLPLLEQ